jgi:hypothetical protein
MDLKTFLTACLGGLVALWVPPIVLAAIRLGWAWVQIRREDLADELIVRKALALSGSLARNPHRPGKTWIIHPAEGWNGSEKKRNSGDEPYCKV